MRVSVFETQTFESQSQLSRPKLRLSEVGLRFETKNEKLGLTLGYEQFYRPRPLKTGP